MMQKIHTKASKILNRSTMIHRCMLNRLLSVTVYGHYVSQPARAVCWLLKANGIDFNFNKVEPMRGDCKKEQYLSKFPTGLSPAIEVTTKNDGRRPKITNYISD